MFFWFSPKKQSASEDKSHPRSRKSQPLRPFGSTMRGNSRTHHRWSILFSGNKNGKHEQKTQDDVDGFCTACIPRPGICFLFAFCHASGCFITSQLSLKFNERKRRLCWLASCEFKEIYIKFWTATTINSIRLCFTIMLHAITKFRSMLRKTFYMYTTTSQNNNSVLVWTLLYPKL